METTTLILSAIGGAQIPPATQDAARPLRDAVQRALRSKRPRWVALALHLSQLPPPAPRPHHRRIARAVLDDAASRREGQLFTLANGDLVLLFPAPDGGVGLAATLGQLFAADAPDIGTLVSRWLLPVDVNGLFSFLDRLSLRAAPLARTERDTGLAAVTAISASLEANRVRELLDRQTGILLALSGATRLVPLYREIRFSLPALETRAAMSGHVTTDPFLFRHLMAALTPAMLAAVSADLRRESGPLAWAHGGRPMLHIDLTVEAILSPLLEDLQAAAAATGLRVAVEIAIVEACADADAFVRARERLRAAEFQVVLDDVTYQMLMITHPAALLPDLLKLDWARTMPQAGEGLEAAIARFGADRIVLQRADTEDAVRWGLARGIRRFQGRHIDSILAASRIAACPEATLCTLRKCGERENAATNAGRVGCGNLALLDAAAPFASRQAA